jgi:hypothetical protein
LNALAQATAASDSYELGRTIGMATEAAHGFCTDLPSASN